MMFYHIETAQLFPTKQKAQAKLKVLAPPLEPVAILPRPEVTAAQVATRDDVPELVNGEWVLGWTVRGMTTEELAEARSNAKLDRFEFAGRAAEAGFVTYAEAAQWAAGNAVPAAVQAIIDTLPLGQQGPVTLDVLARPVIRRTGDLMPALAAAFQTNDAGLDALFGLT